MTTPVDRVLWYIEGRLDQPLNLSELARVGSVSRYHLCRAFAYRTGFPVMQYIRARRLSEAARQLAGGCNDILGLALNVGYGSHESFSRAFRQHFGTTPEQLRHVARLDQLELTEALGMNQSHHITITEPELVSRQQILLVGIDRHYAGSNAGIPGQWQDFNALAEPPNIIGECAWGVVHDIDDNQHHQYFCGYEVDRLDDVPHGMSSLQVPARTHAVFRHPGHVSEIQAVCAAIYDDWLPDSGYQVAEAGLVERYPAAFQPDTGMGGFEIWLPVQG